MMRAGRGRRGGTRAGRVARAERRRVAAPRQPAGRAGNAFRQASIFLQSGAARGAVPVRFWCARPCPASDGPELTFDGTVVHPGVPRDRPDTVPSLTRDRPLSDRPLREISRLMSRAGREHAMCRAAQCTFDERTVNVPRGTLSRRGKNRRRRDGVGWVAGAVRVHEGRGITRSAPGPASRRIVWRGRRGAGGGRGS